MLILETLILGSSVWYLHGNSLSFGRHAWLLCKCCFSRSANLARLCRKCELKIADSSRLIDHIKEYGFFPRH